MNRLKLSGKTAICMLLLSFVITACSDDDAPSLSRTIKRIEIWEMETAQSNLLSYLNLSYGKDGKLSQVSGDNASGIPLVDINYTYPDNDSFLYTYAADDVSLGRITGTLEKGRTYSCKFTNTSNPVVYTYMNDGYLKRSDDQDIVLEYGWKGGNLSTVKSSERAYNSEFKASSIPNNYSIDLNVLPQLLAGSAYMQVMNTYCWMSGILGKRSKCIVEETIYSYKYGYDEKGRLSEIVIIPLLSSKNSSYSFKLAYEEK